MRADVEIREELEVAVINPRGRNAASAVAHEITVFHSPVPPAGCGIGCGKCSHPLYDLRVALRVGQSPQLAVIVPGTAAPAGEAAAVEQREESGRRFDGGECTTANDKGEKTLPPASD